MSGGVQASSEHLTETATAFDAHTDEFFRLKNQLMEGVEEARSRLSGQMADALDEVSERADDALNRISRALGDISEKLASAGSGYAQQEDDSKHNLTMNFGEDKFSDGRDGKSHGDGKTDAAAPVDAKTDVDNDPKGDGTGDGKTTDTGGTAQPADHKGPHDPLDPGKSAFVGDIASTRDPKGHGGIKGADLGVPAKLSDGTPIMLFGDSNKPGDDGKYNGGIVAAKVDNDPNGVKVTGVDGWGPGQLLKEQPPAGQVSYPSGVITLDDKQLLTVADVKVGQTAEGTPTFGPQSSHLVQIGGAEGGWPSVGGSIDAGKGVGYATGMQDGNTVYVAATENNSGPIQLYEIPVDHITDRASWDQYKVGDSITGGGGGTPQMARVGDQYVLSYMDGNGLNVRVADTPGGFGSAPAQTVDIGAAGGYPDPPGVSGAYGGYVLPDSQPDDLRFAVSYFDDSKANGEPYGVGEWRYRPR